ncbi:MAG: transposase [Treponema sp.]|nr:transposase [Treponema sp.]
MKAWEDSYEEIREQQVKRGAESHNRHVALVTSITDATLELILDLYRQRWRIDMVFKRLKSLFKYHETPVHGEPSARAWFYGKLLLAALCETWVNRGRFSPSAGRSTQ